MTMHTTTFRDVTIPVEGMSCGSCVRHIRRALDEHPGVKTAEVNLAEREVTVCFNPERTGVAAIVETIRNSGYRALMPEEQE